MKATIEDGFAELYDGDTLVMVNYSDKIATIGCGGNYLHITSEQFDLLSKLMKTASVCALISCTKNGD